MKLGTKIWLIAAAVLFLLGAILFVGAMNTMDWDFTKLSTNKMETRRHVLAADFKDISIRAVTADVTVLPATDGKAAVVCTEQAHVRHSVSVEDGTLVIQVKDTRKWYHHIGIHLGSPAITVYLPAGEYGDVSVKATTGDIRIRDLTAKAIGLSVTTGDAELTDIACARLSLDTTTGSAKLKNVVAADSLKLHATTGDVTFQSCDAKHISVEATTGDVSGTLRTGKIFDVQTTTGDIDIPSSTGEGECRIRLVTGDVKLNIS